MSARALLAVVWLLTAADGLYLVADLRRAAVPGRCSAAGYLLAVGAFGVAFLHPTMRRLFAGRFAPSRDPPRIANRLVAVVLAPAVLAVIGLTDPNRSADQRVVIGVLGGGRGGPGGRAGVAGGAGWVRRTRRGSCTRSTHDPLTGLGNRAFAERSISAALAEGARARDGVAVIFLDIDRFKLVNDTHGYSCGDQLLIEVGERLTGVFDRRGAVARVGGDEFVVVLFPVATDGPGPARGRAGPRTRSAPRSPSTAPSSS